MSEDYGNDFITVISEEDGSEFVLEHLDTVEIDDVYYMAFVPADMDEDDEDFGLVILKAISQGDDDDDDILVSLDDEEELNRLYEIFLERLSDYEEEEET